MEQNIIDTLHPLEIKLLDLFREASRVSEAELLTLWKEEPSSLRTAIQWLIHKNILNEEKGTEEEIVTVTETGMQTLKEGLIEEKVYLTLKNSQGKNLTLKELAFSLNLTAEELGPIIGLFKQHNLITIEREGKISFSSLLPIPKEVEEKKKLLQEISRHNYYPTKYLTSKQREIIKSVSRKRGGKKSLFKIDTLIEKYYSLTREGELLLKALSTADKMALVGPLTSELLESGKWREVKFREYNINLPAPKVIIGRKNPYRDFLEKTRKKFLAMGFQEMEGPWVETSFWCLDSMWIPQDHPAREIQDTFYLPDKGKLPDKKIVEKVIACHEYGGKTGSKGYGYKWNPEVARQLLLRTHTTATTFRYFGEKNIKPPAKYFYIGRIFRNEAVDATHLAEFHQVEGFVIDDGLTLRHLMGVIRDFYAKMGIYKIRFKPTYKPYTEPSMEALYYDEKRKKWIELINSGIFRPEALEPFGIKKPVIAWGLGLERLAMILHEKNNLRDIVGAGVDFDYIKRHKAVVRKD